MKVLLVFLYLLLLSINIWLFYIRPSHYPWHKKIGFLLQLLGIYSLSFGFLQAIGVLDIFDGLSNGMTSSNLYAFVGSNFHFLSILFSSLAVALEPIKESYGSFYVLKLFFLMLISILVFVYSIFHVLVIVPLAYICNLIVSVPIDAIVNASRDVMIDFGGEKISIKETVSNHSVTLKSFLIGVPAILFPKLANISTMFQQRNKIDKDG